jgi:ethanolamine ammonia-lyase large subunit
VSLARGPSGRLACAMSFRASLRGETFGFADLRELLAKASEEKSGDALAGLAAASETERVAAKLALADVTLGEIADTPLVDDDVTELIQSGHDRTRFAELRSVTVGELRELILSRAFAPVWTDGLAWAFTPEMAAAVAKLMSNKDLVVGAAPLRTVTRLRNTMGETGVLGCRIQPNHPTDAVDGVLVSTLDGLLHGCGDALIGVNPVNESVSSVASVERMLQEVVERLGVPTQTCVLAHITTQLEAMRSGAPVDLLFQSIAGTTAANESFGVTLGLLAEGRAEVLAHHEDRDGFIGTNTMYFETGQGSALSAGAHSDIDQLTCEARAYGVARAFEPFLVNTVVGFIGPEYLADARQITRAGLEDHFMGRLLGLPMGCDVCYTNHADADQNSNDDLLVLLAAAGCEYVMGVPESDDVMLNYQSTSYHDVAAVRRLLGLRPAPEFEAWLEGRGLWRDGGPVASTELASLLHAARARTPARVFRGRLDGGYTTASALALRADHAAARDAVHAALDLEGAELAPVVAEHDVLALDSAAADHREHLLRPDLGRRLSDVSGELVREQGTHGADLQVLIGDGLSAAAVHAQVPGVLGPLLQGARERGWSIGRPLAVRHCRVGILNDVGDILGCGLAVLLVGERPGLATAKSLSAYVALRPRTGQTDADRNLISNIHDGGTSPADGTRRLLALLDAIRAAGRSGVTVKEPTAGALSP